MVLENINKLKERFENELFRRIILNQNLSKYYAGMTENCPEKKFKINELIQNYKNYNINQKEATSWW